MGPLLFEANFCLTDDGAVGFTDFDVCLVPLDDLLVETEAVAQIGLCLVGDFEAVNCLILKAFLGKEVEDVLDVLDAVDVAVDVHVAVVGVDGAQELRLAETETGMALDGTNILFLGNHITEDVSVVEGEQVAGLACLEVYHGPDASCIAQGRPVGAMNGEVTVREVPHDALHPCPDLAMLVLSGHLVHLDGEPGEHPCVAGLVEGSDAPSTPLRVVASSVEHVVAEHAKEDATGKVDMKRLDEEWVGIDAIHGPHQTSPGGGFLIIACFYSHGLFMFSPRGVRGGLSFFFAFRNVGVEAFDAGLGDCDAACTDELQDATEGVELGEELYHIPRDACVLDDGVCGVHFDDAGVVAADYARNVLIGEYHRCGKLQQGGLEDEYLVVDEAVGLQDVDLLLDLLGQHLGHFLLAVAGDGVFVHAWSGRSAYVQALDVDLSAGKDGGYLVEDTCEVLGIDDERVERQSVVTEQSAFVTGYGRTGYGIALEGLLLAAFSCVLSKGGTALSGQVLLEAVAFNGCRRINGFIEALHLLCLLQLVTLAACIAIATLGSRRLPCGPLLTSPRGGII